MLIISGDLKETYPETKFGMLIMKNVQNLKNHLEFDRTKESVKNELLKQHANYNRADFVKSEPVCYYKNYYKKYKKTYPVLLQLESLVAKSIPLPNTSTLIEAMFIAELKNMLLTAAHDYDKIQFPIQLSLASGSESFVGISNKQQFTTINDMMLSDENGIISSILNGPDYRTKITEDTKNVVFYVYAPGDINAITIHNHLNDIINYVSIFAPEAKVISLDIF